MQLRVAFRIFVCLTAWLMFSPAATAALAFVVPQNSAQARPTMACCADGATCEMPARQREPTCGKCTVLVPPALPAVAPDLPPAVLPATDPVPVFEAVIPIRATVVAIQTHPPPETLFALGTLLLC